MAEVGCAEATNSHATGENKRPADAPANDDEIEVVDTHSGSSRGDMKHEAAPAIAVRENDELPSGGASTHRQLLPREEIFSYFRNAFLGSLLDRGLHTANLMRFNNRVTHRGILQLQLGKDHTMTRIPWPFTWEERGQIDRALKEANASDHHLQEAISRVLPREGSIWPQNLAGFDAEGRAGTKRKLLTKSVFKTGVLTRWALVRVEDPKTDRGWTEHDKELIWSRWCKEEHEPSRASKETARSNTSRRPTRSDSESVGCKGQVLYVCPNDVHGDRLMCLPLSLFAYIISYTDPFTGSLGVEFTSWTRSMSQKPVWAFINPRLYGQLNFASTNTKGFRSLCFQARYLQPVKKTWNSARRQADGTIELGFYPRQDKRRQGFLLDRQLASLGGKDKQVHFIERALVVSLSFHEDHGRNFHITVLSDEELEHKVLDPVSRPDAEADHGLWLKGREEGTQQFVVEVMRAMDRAIEAWTETLDRIDNLVRVSLNDFLDDEVVESLMFDSDLTRSKEYFIVSQILRIADEWLEETIRNITDLRELASPGSRHEYHWNQMTDNLTAIRRRIAAKTEEINTLKDALFNATSLREATRGMALNQTIYIFTIVTVIFTPVSFLATFFALPFLNSPSGGSDAVAVPTGFRNSFIILPVLTYAFVLAISWWLRPDKRRYSIRSGLQVAQMKARGVREGLPTFSITNVKSRARREKEKESHPDNMGPV